MPDIYVAGEPRCCTPQGRSIWQCSICGRYWYQSDETDGCAPPTYLWKQVRWWNFRLRAAIRTAPRQLVGGYAPGKKSSELRSPQGLRNPAPSRPLTISAPPNGDHNPARPGDCRRLCGAPGCASWGCLR